MGGLPVVAVASHDTASAIAAIPSEGDDWAFISSGTWSLMGFESDTPLISEASRSYNFTNEGGASGNFRVLKNITGLWLWQQCMAVWRTGRHRLQPHYAVAERAEPFRMLLDPDASEFVAPDE
jgi:rhamnulokinase